MEFTAERARELFDYNPETGDLVWRVDRSNSVRKGRIAGRVELCKWGKRYRFVTVDGKIVRAHRLIWMIVHGHLPKGQIDHINGDGTDNRLENLRDVTHQENSKNRRRQSNNKSGVTGVWWNTKHQKWVASLNCGKQSKHLRMFDDIEDAKAARRMAEAFSMFHPNHGQDRPL